MDRDRSGSDDTERLHLTVLNGVDARRGDRVLMLGPPQRRAVLCVLALRRRQWVSVSTLLAALYETAIPASGANVIQTHVSALRRVLEPDRPPRAPGSVLLSGHGGYQLRIDDDQLDVALFDRLLAAAEHARQQADWRLARRDYEAALALFPGEALNGIPGPFAAGQRDALSERRLTAVEGGLEAAAALSRSDVTIDRLRQLTAEQPLRERPPALLMRALALRGSRADALEVYAATRRALVDMLGVEPGPELQTLHQRILAGEPLADGWITPAHPTPRPASPGSSVFGREPELAEITRHLARAADRAGALIVVAGHPGYGKTAVLEELSRRATDVRQLRPIPPRDDHDRALGLTAEIHTRIGAVRNVATEPDRDSSTDTPLAHLLRDLASAATDRPLLLLIDDAGNADDSSLRMLAEVAPHLRTMRVLVVLAVDDRPWDEYATERQMMLERSAEAVIRLGALERSAVTDWTARDGLDAPGLADEVHCATAGIPRLVTALLADLETLPTPRGVPAYLPDGCYARALRRQFRRNSPALGATLRALSVLPPGITTVPVLAAALDESPAETRHRCELLATARIVTSPDPPEFRHALVSNTIQRMVAPDEARLFRVSAARQARLSGHTACQIASFLPHLTGAEWSEWAEVLLDAARECLSLGDFEDATAHLEAALRIAGPSLLDQVLLRLGRLEQFTNPATARIHLQEALNEQRARKVTATALIPLVWTLTTQRQQQAATMLIDQVLAETETRDPHAARIVSASRWVIAALSPGTRPALVTRLRRERTRPDDVVASAVATWDAACGARCTAEEALDGFLAELRGGAHSDGLPRESTGILALLALYADDLTVAWQLSAQPEDLFFGGVDVFRLAIRTQILLRRGDFHGALTESSPAA